MQDMMETIDTLRDVFTEENEALAGADTKLFMALQNRKITAAKNYKAFSEQFLARKDEIKQASPEMHKKFEEMYSSFSEIALENISQLERMRGGMNRLHDHVMTAARDNADKDGVNYSAGGHLKSHTTSLSMGLNESA